MRLKLAENLKKLRLERNITQEQLANYLGISFKTVSRWETGNGYPDLEIVPMIADYFDVSLETLLGVAKQDREQANKELYEQLQRYPYDSPERTRHLLKMHKEFPKDRAVLYNLCRVTDDLAQKRRFTNEMIQTVNAEENGLDMHTANAIAWLIDVENEDNAQVLMNKYTQPIVLAREFRMESRALAQKNMEQYDMERQKNLLMLLTQPIFDRMKEHSMSTSKKISALRSMIGIMDAMTNTIGINPISGDGEPDLWFPMRFTGARELAYHLASLGEKEMALTIIEDLTDLHEKFWALPNNTILTYRCPLLDKIQASVLYTKMPTLFAEDKENMLRDARHIHIKEIDCHHVVWSYHTYRPFISDEWIGFASIREDVRLKKCIERMIEAEERS